MTQLILTPPEPITTTPVPVAITTTGFVLTGFMFDIQNDRVNLFVSLLDGYGNSYKRDTVRLASSDYQPLLDGYASAGSTVLEAVVGALQTALNTHYSLPIGTTATLQPNPRPVRQAPSKPQPSR